MLHVVWDWNGTLFDDLHVVVEAVNEVMGQADLEPITMEDYRDRYARPVRRFYENLYGRPIGDAEWHELDHVFHEAYRWRLHEAGLRADAAAALDAIDSLGGTQSLLSMWRHDELLDLVQELGISDRFVLVDGLQGPGGGLKAPHLQVHLDRINHDWEETVLIGDAVDDADAALAHDCRVVLIDNGSHPRTVLEQVGAPVASDLLEALSLAGLG